jgi:hypothetical protein
MCLPRRIAGQPFLAHLKELLRSTVKAALRNPFTPAQLGDGIFSAQALKDDADILFGRVLFAGCAADVFDMLLGATLWSGFLAHLRSIMATMIQNAPFVKSLNESHGR